MAETIVVPCQCGKAVPAWIYCYACKQTKGSPNCPCGRPISPIKTQECPGCVPADFKRIETNVRREYLRATGIDCASGDCVIPTCRSCFKADYPQTHCTVCHRDECSRCERRCWADSRDKKSKGVTSTVTYSGKGKRYKEGADKHRPAMFVEAWEYTGGNVTRRTMVGFEKKAREE